MPWQAPPFASARSTCKEERQAFSCMWACHYCREGATQRQFRGTRDVNPRKRHTIDSKGPWEGSFYTVRPPKRIPVRPACCAEGTPVEREAWTTYPERSRTQVPKSHTRRATELPQTSSIHHCSRYGCKCSPRVSQLMTLLL